MTEISDSDKRRSVALVDADDRGNLIAEICNVIAISLLAEATEATEILPYLRCGKAEGFSKET